MEDLKQLIKAVQKRLELEVYFVETKNVFKGAYRSYIRLPNILFEAKLTKHKKEKLLIQVDTEPQGFDYRPDKFIVNKFDVFLRINVVPVDILLAQKIYAIFSHKRPMGRDFFDTVFLLGKTKPNFDYLRSKINIKDMIDLKDRLLLKCKDINFNQLSKDVEQFLFVPSDSKKVLFFYEYVQNYEF